MKIIALMSSQCQPEPSRACFCQTHQIEKRRRDLFSLDFRNGGDRQTTVFGEFGQGEACFFSQLTDVNAKAALTEPPAYIGQVSPILRLFGHFRHVRLLSDFDGIHRAILKQ